MATTNQLSEALALKERLKKGKTEAQKQAIDFLFGEGNGGCGCMKSKSAMTMQSYNAMVQQKCQSLNLYQRAMAKMGLDPSQVQEIPPIVLHSYVYDDDCLVRVDDNNAVSSQYSVAWIFFSDMQMFTYQFIFDTTSDNTWEYTKDFFYTDVTCFSTEQRICEKIRISMGAGCMKATENINKSHYVIDRLELVVPNAKYAFSMKNSPEIQQSIQAAKAMIREKKYSR